METRAGASERAPAPAPTAPPAKRLRPSLNGNGSVPRYALVSCYDDCDRYVEVDTRLLAPFNCRLYKVIQHQEPFRDVNTDKPYWKSTMTRAMLTTMLRSLLHGELSLGKGVSIAEAMTTFEFENIGVGVPAERVGEIRTITGPPAGAAFEKRVERVNDVLLRSSEQIAHAIARWPRLEACLDGALTGGPMTNTCTATRAWVRFCRKPVVTALAGDRCVALARKWPNWLQASFITFGILHARLCAAGTISSASRDEESFTALETQVRGDVLGWFLMTLHDWPHHAQDRAARRAETAGHTFAQNLRQTIIDAGTRDGPASAAPPGMHNVPYSAEALYARACVLLAERLMAEAPSPANIYSGQCCDDQCKSPERTQFQRSLHTRGIRVVRWAEDEKSTPGKPLVFPPNWAEGPHSGSQWCSVLLDFSDRR